MKDNYDVIFSVDINNQLDKVIPVNPITGTRDNILTKYEIALTDSERHNLEAFLGVQQANNPHGHISDSDLISLCPSRYIASISDVRDVAKAMRTIVNSLDNADSSSEVSSAVVSSAADSTTIDSGSTSSN